MLRTRPERQAPGMSFSQPPPFPGVGQHEGPPRGTVVLVAGAEGDFLEIETAATPPGETHCEDTQLGLDALRLRMYVPRDAVLPVVTRSIDTVTADGAEVHIRAGVPLAPSKGHDDLWIAAARGRRTELPLPSDAVGPFYEPDAFESPLTGCIEVDEVLTPEQPPRSRPAPPHYPTGVMAYDRGWGELKAAVRPGTPLYWTDGRVAGQVVEPLLWDPRSDDVGRLHCTWTPRLLNPALDLRICFDPADVFDPVTAALAAAVGHPTITEPRNHGTVHIRPPQVTGSATLLVVRHLVRSHAPELRYCYGLSLTDDPRVDGDVTLRLDIAPDGTLDTVSQSSSSLSDPDLEACILRAARGWSFPAHRGPDPSTVTVPLLFMPR